MGGAKLPPTVPRWLSLLRSFKFVNNPIPILDQNIRKYGSTHSFHIGGIQKGIITSDPSVIQHVLQKNHRNYHKSPIQSVVLAHFVGKGLLTANGSYWLRQRRLIQPGFHRERLSHLVKLMNEEIADYCKELSTKLVDSAKIDMYAEMHGLAFRLVAKTLFSASLGEQELLSLSDQITRIQAFIIKIIRQPYARSWFKLAGQQHKHEQLADEAKDIMRQIIRDRMNAGRPSDDLLQMLIDARYEDTLEPMTEEQILDECLIIFIAGHETSANALAWALYLIAKNPPAKAKLEAEVACVEDLSKVNFSDLKKLSYTKKVLEESLRIYPPAWIIDRVALENDEVNSWKIPKDTLLMLYIYGTHHHPDYWTDPEYFDPERFDPDLNKTRLPFSYIPFGGGPRLCIGNNFAMIEMQLILSQLMQKFDLNLASDGEVEIEPMITLRSRGGIWFEVKNKQK